MKNTFEKGEITEAQINAQKSINLSYAKRLQEVEALMSAGDNNAARGKLEGFIALLGSRG